MPTHLKILHPSEVKSFDLPPATLSAQARKQFFVPTKAVMTILDKFRTPTNKVGFLVQMGYFKVV